MPDQPMPSITTQRMGVTSRRRLLTMSAAVAGLGAGWWLPARQRTDLVFEWTGTALGAPARLVLHHPDRAAAARIVAACLDEIDRLEQEFSLFRDDSALSRLNRNGCLDRPSLDMRRLIAEALRFGELSAGAFDVSIQPLWRLHAEHFARWPSDQAGPPLAAIRAASAVVDHRLVEVSARQARLGRPGMALTLNGIAQGFITDRITDLLRDAGLTHVLIDIGEMRALDGHPDGRPWRVGIDHPRGSAGELDLVDRAVATSCGQGTRFDREGRFHHIIHPLSGACPSPWRAVSVIAPSATVADALATTLCLVPDQAVDGIVAAFEGVGAVISHDDGRRTVIGRLDAVRV